MRLIRIEAQQSFFFIQQTNTHGAAELAII
jgi:hypothetical protein